jgi:hypothetical protein
MENLPARVPHTLLPNLVAAFVPEDTPAGSVVELVITIEGEDILAREFAEYLSLIDRLYGRLSPDGIMSYAHRDEERLRIAEIHKSELEIIFRILHGHWGTAALIAILLFLRSLPNMFKVTTEGIKTLADAYKSYEEGKLARENRKKIRETIKQDSALVNLDDSRKGQLTRLLDALAMIESTNLPAPIRFARRQVKSVIIRVRKENPPS